MAGVLTYDLGLLSRNSQSHSHLGLPMQVSQYVAVVPIQTFLLLAFSTFFQMTTLFDCTMVLANSLPICTLRGHDMSAHGSPKPEDNSILIYLFNADDGDFSQSAQ